MDELRNNVKTRSFLVMLYSCMKSEVICSTQTVDYELLVTLATHIAYITYTIIIWGNFCKDFYNNKRPQRET